MPQRFISDQEMMEQGGPGQIQPQAPSAANIPSDDPSLGSRPPRFISDQDFVPDNEKYSSPEQQILGGLEAVGRGALPGISTALEVGSGLTTPEDIRGREEALHPAFQFLGTALGTAGLSAMTGGFGGLAGLPEAALTRKVLGGAALGGLFGAGNVLSDAALGDPNLNAQKIMADIGFSAALGGGIGGLSKALGALPAMLRRQAIPLAEKSEADIKTAVPEGWNLGWPLNTDSEINDAASATVPDVAPDISSSISDKLSAVYDKAKGIKNVVGAIRFAMNPGKGLFKTISGVGNDLMNKYIDGLTPEQIESGSLQTEAILKLKSLLSLKDRITEKMEDLAAGALEKGSLTNPSIGGASKLSDQEYDRITNQLNQIQTFPDQFHNEVSDSTQHLYQAAPNITMGLQKNLMQGVEFLHSKIPQPPPQFPLSQKWQPTSMQKAQFSRYYAAVNNPFIAFKQMKTGHLNNETMESLQAVHPELLQNMQKLFLEQMKTEKAAKLPYFQKLSISKFLNTPLDATMTSQGVMANNMAFAPMAPPPQAQGGQSQKKPTLGGLKQLDVASRAATMTQQYQEEG